MRSHVRYIIVYVQLMICLGSISEWRAAERRAAEQRAESGRASAEPPAARAPGWSLIQTNRNYTEHEIQFQKNIQNEMHAICVSD